MFGTGLSDIKLSEQCEGRVGPAVPGAEPQHSPGRAQSNLSVVRARLAGGTGGSSLAWVPLPGKN